MIAIPSLCRYATLGLAGFLTWCAMAPAIHASEGNSVFGTIPVISEAIDSEPPAEPLPPSEPSLPQEPEPPLVEPPIVEPPVTVPVPMVIASYSSSCIPAPGQEARIEVTFENRGDTPILSPVASFSPTAGLALVDGQSSFAVEDIGPHETRTVAFTVIALEDAGLNAQNLLVSTSFYYQSGGQLIEASRTDTLPVRTAATQAPSADPTPDPGADGNEGMNWGGDLGGDWGGGITQTTTPESTVDKPVPNIIVSGFTYGDGVDAVATGSTFPLTFSFTNTSAQLTSENIVVSVDTGDKFAINGGTNTFYVASMAPGETQQQTLMVKALSSERNDPGSLTISFKYEYVDQDQRKQATSEVRLTVPTYQQDRFSLATPTIPSDAMAGVETMITLPYVNKGKSAVGNVSASIDGPNIQTMSSVQNLGNIEAGKSGTIGFVFTPLTSGRLDLTITIEYENANEEPVVKTFPVTLDVMDFPVMDFGDEGLYDDSLPFEEAEPPASLPLWAWVGLGAAVVALFALALRLHKRRKKQRRADRLANDSWDLTSSIPPIAYGTPKAADAPVPPRTTVPPMPGAHAAPPKE